MIIALLIALTLGDGSHAIGGVPQADPAAIRVHVRAAGAGEAPDLRESVKHLVAAIAGRKKSGLVTVANAEDVVDVVVEIEERAVTVPKVVIGLSGGLGAQAGRPGPPVSPVKAVQLRATIGIAREADSDPIVNKNRANDSESGWKSAAEDLAKHVERWVADHRASILEARRRR